MEGSVISVVNRRPLTREPSEPEAEVIVLTDRCKGCEFCVEYCPTDTLAMSDEYNEQGYHYPVVVSDDCVDCQLCSRICPEFAIYPKEEYPGEHPATPMRNES